jgi:hypothetical protein
MSIWSRGSVKRISDCGIGEFVKLQLDNLNISGFIIAEFSRTNTKLVADCNTIGGMLPSPAEVDDADTCLSYGDDYILELDIGSDPWRDIRFAGSPGTISLWPDARGLILSDDGKSRANIKIFDFDTKTYVNRDTGHGLTIARWQIWANEIDRRTAGVDPVFKFKI